VNVTLLKLGGSVITDKRHAETARDDTLQRLAEEIAQALPHMDARLLIGHGSGSFGHTVAAANGLSRRAFSSDPAGIAATQAAAAALHRRVVDALLAVGLPVFSFPPSAAAVADEAGIERYEAGPVALALGGGLIPVVYGDVVLAPEGAVIASTEMVFEGLVQALPSFGWCVERILWAGDTEGVYDSERAMIPEIDPDSFSAEAFSSGAIGGSNAVDVTGGMAHRVSVAVELARSGVGSWIGDGGCPGRIEEALRERGRAPGTRVRVR